MSGYGTRPFVVLTRPVGKNEALVQRLAQQEIDALALPALKVRPLSVPVDSLPLPQDFDLVIFVSGNAVRLYLDAWSNESQPWCWPLQTVAATVGSGSAAPLLQSPTMSGSTVIYPPANVPQDSESLWVLLQPLLPSLKRVLIVRGQAGREWLGSQFEARGVTVTRLAVYQREPAVWTTSEVLALRHYVKSGRQGIYVLTSVESVNAFHAKMLELDMDDYWQTARFVVIHPRVAERLQSLLAARPNYREEACISLCQPDEDALFMLAHALASL